tara:strand:+ start:389 stop:586 length:198 start_codon:yes stop_codon:yes gene_type:complete
MEAHKVKYGTKVKVIDENVNTPPSSIPVKKGDVITIFRPDGMWSNGKDSKGNRIYIAGWTRVQEV